jgi:hypothetical protein
MKKKKSHAREETLDWNTGVEKRSIYETRRKKPKKAANSTPVVLSLVIIGVLLVIGAGVTLFVVQRTPAARHSAASDNNPGQAGLDAPQTSSPETTGSPIR